MGKAMSKFNTFLLQRLVNCMSSVDNLIVSADMCEHISFKC